MTKTRFIFVAKLTVSVALLTYLLRQADFEGIWQSTQNAQWSLIAVVFLLFFLHFYIGALRWRLLSRLHGVNPSVGYLFRSYMVANFFNNFLPSTIGGDVVRIYDTSRAGTSKSSATAIIFVDRVVGVLTLAVLAAVGMLLLGSREIFSFELRGLVVLLIIMLVGIIVVLFHPPGWWIKLVERLISGGPRLISSMARMFQKVSSEFRGARKTLGLALLLSFLLQSNVILEYYLIGIAIGIDLSPVVFIAIVPLALILIMLPVSINGIGLRESVFSILFGLFGIAVEAALVFSWIFYGLFLAHGILGGVVYALRKDRLPRRDPSPE